MEIRAEFAALRHATHRGDDASPDDDRAHVASAALAHEALHEHVLLREVERLDERERHLVRLGEHHADALRAFEQLHDERRGTEALEHRGKRATITRVDRGRDRNVVTREELERAQLVARRRDRVRAVEREHAQVLELTKHGGARLRDRGADPRQDRVDVVERAPLAEDHGGAGLDDHREPERVEDDHVVATCDRRIPQTRGAVAVGLTGEDRDLHRDGSDAYSRACRSSIRERGAPDTRVTRWTRRSTSTITRPRRWIPAFSRRCCLRSGRRSGTRTAAHTRSDVPRGSSSRRRERASRP